LAQRFEPGTELVIESCEGASRARQPFPTRVIRGQPTGNGNWADGGQFLQPLVEEELATPMNLFFA
jgi:hypothetical protein